MLDDLNTDTWTLGHCELAHLCLGECKRLILQERPWPLPQTSSAGGAPVDGALAPSIQKASEEAEWVHKRRFAENNRQKGGLDASRMYTLLGSTAPTCCGVWLIQGRVLTQAQSGAVWGVTGN